MIIETKRCPSCGIEKPLIDFAKDKNRARGVTSRCKVCSRAYGAKYRALNADAQKKKSNDYYARNKDKIAAKRQTEEYKTHRREWERSVKDRPERKERIRVNGRNFHERVWSEAIKFFGPCACCGESTPEFLSLDHINGNGAEERKKGKSGMMILSALRRAGWPEESKNEYRLLCFNCNFSIGHYGFCPHHPEKKYSYYSVKRHRIFKAEEQ